MDWRKIIRFPLAYDRDGGWIIDKDGGPVLQIRAYGKISSKVQYDVTKSNEIQDSFAEEVVKCLNENLRKK